MIDLMDLTAHAPIDSELVAQQVMESLRASGTAKLMLLSVKTSPQAERLVHYWLMGLSVMVVIHKVVGWLVVSICFSAGGLHIL